MIFALPMTFRSLLAKFETNQPFPDTISLATEKSPMEVSRSRESELTILDARVKFRAIRRTVIRARFLNIR